MTDTVIVYRSQSHQQMDEMVTHAYQSGDMIWFWGLVLTVLIIVAIIAEWKSRKR